MTSSVSRSPDRSALSAWFFRHWAACLVLAFALLAYGGTLRADFYMDDLGFVTDSFGTDAPKMFVSVSGNRYGSPDPDAMMVTPMNAIPSAIFWLTGVVAPANPVVSHLWNLLFHLTLSVVVYRLGRQMLVALDIFQRPESNERAALLGALIFACHPLGSEAVYYAKCINTQVVALFGFWATVRAAQFLRAPDAKSAGAVVLPTVLTVLSYFPGVVQLALSIAVLALAAGPRQLVARVRPQLTALWTKPAGKGVIAAAALGLVYLLSFYVPTAIWNLGHANYDEHLVTQGRIFWEYARRLVWPTGLCSDHFLPWSAGFSDTGGVLLTAGWLLMAGLVAWVALRRPAGPAKAAALLALLTLLPFLIRLLYVNNELMVEYRAYPALPWFGLLLGSGLAALWERQRVASLSLAALVVAAGAVLSAERGLVWREWRTLSADVLAQYPLNNRARTQLQSLDYDDGNYAEVLRRHQEILAVRQEIARRNTQTAGISRIDNNRTEAATMNSYQWSIYARAELEGPATALRWAEESITRLKTVLPGQFGTGIAGDNGNAWSVLMARDAVAKAAAAQVPAGVR